MRLSFYLVTLFSLISNLAYSSPIISDKKSSEVQIGNIELELSVGNRSDILNLELYLFDEDLGQGYYYYNDIYVKSRISKLGLYVPIVSNKNLHYFISSSISRGDIYRGEFYLEEYEEDVLLDYFSASLKRGYVQDIDLFFGHRYIKDDFSFSPKIGYYQNQQDDEIYNIKYRGPAIGLDIDARVNNSHILSAGVEFSRVNIDSQEGVLEFVTGNRRSAKSISLGYKYEINDLTSFTISYKEDSMSFTDILDGGLSEVYYNWESETFLAGLSYKF